MQTGFLVYLIPLKTKMINGLKMIYDPSKIEYHGHFDMLGGYIYQTIVQDTGINYFGVNTYGEDCDFTIDSCVCHAANLQAHDHSLLPSVIFQIS